MATLYYDKDADLGLLEGKTIAVIGYGSQGHAHALNARDNGQRVIVGLHEGSGSRAKAAAEGLEVMSVAEATAAADVVMVLIPDTLQAQVYEESIEPKSLRRRHVDVRSWLQHSLRPDQNRRPTSTSP